MKKLAQISRLFIQIFTYLNLISGSMSCMSACAETNVPIRLDICFNEDKGGKKNIP